MVVLVFVGYWLVFFFFFCSTFFFLTKCFKCEDDYTNNNNEGPESPLNILKILAVCAHRVEFIFSPIYSKKKS